jgi:hypothetical protein
MGMMIIRHKVRDYGIDKACRSLHFDMPIEDRTIAANARKFGRGNRSSPSPGIDRLHRQVEAATRVNLI